MLEVKTLEGKKILVTGGAGFIGSNLCEKLLELKVNVVCLDNFSTGKRENVAPKLLANVEDLEKIAEDDNAEVKALSGWRYELFGKNAIALKNGEVAFAIKNDEIVILPL